MNAIFEIENDSPVKGQQIHCNDNVLFYDISFSTCITTQVAVMK